MTTTQRDILGSGGRIVLHAWPASPPRWVALIAHGYGEHARRYDHVAQYLVGRGASVYAPDHLGHGLSEGERALVEDVEDLVDDLAAAARVASAEHPDLPMVLVGHSMGGIVATRFAQRHGERLAGLILSGPAIGGADTLEMLLAMDPLPEVPIDPEALSRDPEVGRTYVDDPLVWHGPFRRATLRGMAAAMRTIAGGPTLTLPTLWMHGSEDPLVPLDETRAAVERIDGGRLESIVYPGARHEVFNETNRDEVLAALGEFVDRVLAAR